MRTRSKEQLTTEQSKAERLPQKCWYAVGRLYDACLKNAEQLLDEAELLLKNKYHARAIALALIAWEEIGKSQIVADYFNDMVSRREFEEAFARHEIKSAYNFRQFRVTSTKPFKAVIEYDRTKAKEYSQYRMASLYVQCREDYEPRTPSEEVKKDDAAAAIRMCRKEIEHIHKMEIMTELIGSKSFTK